MKESELHSLLIEDRGEYAYVCERLRVYMFQKNRGSNLKCFKKCIHY